MCLALVCKMRTSLALEDRLVAELERLGIHYLARESIAPAKRVRSPERLISALIQQPSSRVRTAVIALLLAYPQFAEAIPAALERLERQDQQTLKLFYTATVYLQKKYAGQLQPFLAKRWVWLPDYFSEEMNLREETHPEKLLHQLGLRHRQLTGVVANWQGTYENVAQHLLHRWQLEQRWS